MGDKQCIHYWITDSRNVGRCKYCPAVKDFSALLRGEEGKNALKTVSLTKSVAASERWQDPEYQAKQSAAMKKRWQGPEYRAKMSAARVRQHNKIGGNEN